MKYIDRLFVVLIALVVALASLGLMAFSTGLIEGWELIDSFAQEPLAVGLISLIAFLISIRVLQVSFSRKTKASQTVITTGELGNIKITLGAIKKLVKSIIDQEAEVKDIKSSVKVKEEGVSIFLELAISSPGNISDLAKRLQREVTEQVSATTGAKVAEVEVLIEEVKRDPKPPEVKVD